MTATNILDFKLLLSKIPKERFEKVWFFPVRQDRKNPDVSSGTVLKGNVAYRLSVKECINRLKWGKNIGIYALSGGLMFLDLDVEKGKLKASDYFMQLIPPTFAVRTRNGGVQYYYLNDGAYSNQIIKENGIEIGELRTDWYYVVGAGSYVEPDGDNNNGDGTYRVINNVPIVSFQGMNGYVQKRNDVKQDETKIFSKKTEPIDSIDIKEYERRLKEKGKIRVPLSDNKAKGIIKKIQKG